MPLKIDRIHFKFRFEAVLLQLFQTIFAKAIVKMECDIIHYFISNLHIKTGTLN